MHNSYVQTRTVSIETSIDRESAEICSLVSGYPKLIEVTLEDLDTGLESGLFTSVDLVNVRPRQVAAEPDMTLTRSSRRIFQGSMRSTVLCAL